MNTKNFRAKRTLLPVLDGGKQLNASDETATIIHFLHFFLFIPQTALKFELLRDIIVFPYCKSCSVFSLWKNRNWLNDGKNVSILAVFKTFRLVVFCGWHIDISVLRFLR